MYNNNTSIVFFYILTVTVLSLIKSCLECFFFLYLLNLNIIFISSKPLSCVNLTLRLRKENLTKRRNSILLIETDRVLFKHHYCFSCVLKMELLSRRRCCSSAGRRGIVMGTELQANCQFAEAMLQLPTLLYQVLLRFRYPLVLRIQFITITIVPIHQSFILKFVDVFIEPHIMYMAVYQNVCNFALQ